MMKRRHQIMASFGSVLLLCGCGSDHEADIQKEELRAKVVQRETQLNELIKSHQAEFDSLKKVVDQHSRQLSSLTSRSTRPAEMFPAPNRSPQAEDLTSNQQRLRSKEYMMREGSERPDYASASRSQAASMAIIRQSYGTQSAEEVARILNDRNIRTRTGSLWTAAEVKKIAAENKLEKTGVNKN